MKIGELATRAGVSTRALRYYEEQGLLTPARTMAGHRIYTEASLARVQLIQQLFTAGLNSRLLVRLLPAIDAKYLEPDLLAHLKAEHARLAADISELQAAHRRLGVLLALSADPDARECATTLDQTMNDDDAVSRSQANSARVASLRRNHAT